MCYNSTSPFLFLQTYYSLIIGYIQKRVTISSKKVDGFFKKRVCQNVHILFFMHKAPTFSSQGFAIS